MTVRDLIEELEELPMDYPVLIDNEPITSIEIKDAWYCLVGDIYQTSPAVVLG